MKKLALAEYQEDNKFLFKDLKSITDPSLREFFQNEQSRIMQKRAQQQGQGPQNNSNSFQYFDNLTRFETNLPKYFSYFSLCCFFFLILVVLN